MPRNSKLTPELGKQIVDLIKAGNFAKQAAEACGISESTYYDWLDKGEKAHQGIFRLFYEEIQKANALGETSMVSALYQNGINGDTRAQVEYLSRRFPERWGGSKTVKAEVSGVQVSFLLPDNGRDTKE